MRHGNSHFYTSTRGFMTSFAAMSGSSEGALSNPVIFFIFIALICTCFVILWLIKSSKDIKAHNRGANIQNSKRKSSISNKQQQQPPQPPKKKVVTKQTSKGSATQSPKFEHPHLVSTLKGHTGQLTGGDFSSNGKQFITAAEDRTVLIWNTKDFGGKNKKSSRGNIQYDHAQHICWSPDTKAFVIFKAVESGIDVYKVKKRQDGTYGEIQKAFSFPEYNRNITVIALGVAVSGKFIMTCDEKNQLTLWDLKGKILEKIDTRHGDTYSAQISPCGRFIVTTGFTPDAKVWEVKFNKNGGYECLKRVFELKGHGAGIYNSSINCDSSRMATISKDGTWRLYDTQVEYEQGQEPYFLLSNQYKKSDIRPVIALSPDGRTVVVGTGSDLNFYSAITGESLYLIHNIYLDHIKDVRFEPSSKYLITIGDKHPRVFINVAGYQTLIQDLERSKAKSQTSAMKDRITAQIQEAKNALKDLNMTIPQ